MYSVTQYGDTGGAKQRPQADLITFYNYSIDPRKDRPKGGHVHVLSLILLSHLAEVFVAHDKR